MTFEIKIRGYAQRLVAHEANFGKPPCGATIAAFRVASRLRRPLSELAGQRGFRALLLRALALAKREASLLNSVRVLPDGSLEGFGEVSEHGGEDEAAAAIILIAQLFLLLSTFIGESLTLRLIQSEWPDLPFDDTNPRGTN
jgi:hypothetical protein